jgi:hypothetical protein
MQFEVKHALLDLGQKTPEYFLREIFSHGSLKVRQDAQKELQTLDPKRQSARILRNLLELI